MELDPRSCFFSFFSETSCTNVDDLRIRYCRSAIFVYFSLSKLAAMLTLVEDPTSRDDCEKISTKASHCVSSSFLGIRLWPLSAFSFLQRSDRLDKRGGISGTRDDPTGCLESSLVWLQFNLRHINPFRNESLNSRNFLAYS